MKIAVIGIVGLPASYGGFETLVEQLVDTNDAEFTVYCSSNRYKKKISTYKNANLIYIPLNANGVMSVLYDIVSIIHGIATGHRQFLILGVSGMVILPLLQVLFPKVKTVVNIDGCEWRREKFGMAAKLFLKYSESLAVKFATTVVADNQVISEDVSKRYRRSCELIAYGGDHALMTPHLKLSDNSLIFNHSFALSVCRIEPENNIHMILEAFSKSDLSIIFIGNWESSDYGRSLFSSYKDYKNIKLLMPIYCLETLYTYRSACAVYIHGHSAGGTNPSLVEMMHFSKSIVAYDCSFNRATMENRGDYFTDSDNLAHMLGNLTALDNGNALKEIAKRRYTWDIVRKQYLKLLQV
ncbi:DUF1972 domain-containing protein [Gammaproteobacteria bacterium]|nr:DUF1972 domain-containing protein [Gammaproteobacteria bacterium]